ncbi:MAG: enoyl-CoA hydratase-related protein, partial [Pseudomonadales bacterium]|nr:enoyl-CoA hydratase-related protein [Pseudomonadales bacterium]
LFWSSRKVEAEEALTLGLVNRVFPGDELIQQAKAYIQNLSDHSAPSSMMVMKQQVYRHLNMSLGESMRETTTLMDASLEHEDFNEGVKSYLEKRPPNFSKIEC